MSVLPASGRKGVHLVWTVELGLEITERPYFWASSPGCHPYNCYKTHNRVLELSPAPYLSTSTG